MINATAISENDNLLDLQSVTKAYRLETKEFLAVKDINLQLSSVSLSACWGRPDAASPHCCE